MTNVAKLRRHWPKDTRPNLATYHPPFREIGLIGFGVLALYLLIAIVSHSPSDTSFSFSGDATEVRNWAGSSGAYVSDLLLYLFGLVAYLLPVAVLLLGVRLIYRGSDRPAWFTASVRGIGWTAVTLGACLLIQTHAPANADLPVGPGGVLGQSLNHAGVSFLGAAGVTLLGAAGVLAGAQAALGFSWLDIAEWVGRGIHRLAAAMIGVAARRLELWRQRRAARTAARRALAERSEKRAKDGRRRKTQKPPRIEPRAQPAPEAPKVKQGEMFDKAGLGAVPDMDLLDDKAADDKHGYSDESLEIMSRQLELKLREFGVEVEVVSVLPGPVVTRFEVQPAPGLKAQKISSLAKDLARTLAVSSVRVVEVIPGKSVVGIEIPNTDREVVRLKEIFASEEYKRSKSPLSLALGKDVAGTPVVTDISRMPHLLIAGTTGSGKSVGVNAMLISILYKAPPEQVRLILVDPKMLELSAYEGIPHLLAPVVTDVTQAGHALNWCVGEMERRYRLMAALGVRNLAGYNRHVSEAEKAGASIPDPLAAEEQGEDAPPLAPLPFILVVIDEFADMMMVVGKQVEQLIARIAQKARAAGIHLVLATQRPSVNVITGLIKANIPARISFQVSSRVDSRTILDQGGAEQLLGYGDMLFLPPGTSVPSRVHGAFVADDEVHRVVEDWKLRGQPNYLGGVLSGGSEPPFVEIEPRNGSTEQDDPLYDEAVEFVIQSRRGSISSVQRKLRIGYNRAARLIEAMQEAGLISPADSNGSREVLAPPRD